MKVRIIGHSDQSADWWYIDHVGEEFDAKQSPWSEDNWWVTSGPYTACGIHKKDAEVVG